MNSRRHTATEQNEQEKWRPHIDDDYDESSDRTKHNGGALRVLGCAGECTGSHNSKVARAVSGKLLPERSLAHTIAGQLGPGSKL